MTINEKMSLLKRHKEWKCNLEWEALDEHEQTWRSNGLRDLNYEELGRELLGASGGKVVKVEVDVKLNGDHWTNGKSGIDVV